MRVTILGAGGHGRAVCEAALDAGFEVMGFLDGRAPLPEVLGLPVLGTEAAHGGGPLFIALGDNPTRLAAAARLGSPLPVLLHPSVVRARSAEIGEGAVVMPRAVLGAQARIGRLALVNTGAIVEHDVTIEEGAHVAPGAVICGGVTIGTCAMVGAGAVIAPNLRVGAGAVIGAGAAVLENIAAGSRMGGVPARSLR
ncbi:NeuD/PglB/VioB family sugar acetyltransferase [Roseococcus sp. YIM B11640]|uniref:NeuD/PglB/VioB family sugar acetyltransferase n=1 Tax=Roseococcus sp. YIM B11640 TaxID=3133973 RepID=UPI003C7D8C08